jgi:surfeit locus 1 family protein
VCALLPPESLVTERADLFTSLAIIPEFVYRKVLMKGKWDYGHTIVVGPRTRDGTAGYHIIIPLVRSDGTTVLVDRGFVSKDAFAKFSKADHNNEETFVQGMLRVSQVRNAFTPNNHPEKGEWYWIDVDAMAEHAGGDRANVQPVLVEEIFGMRSAWRCYVSFTLSQRDTQGKRLSD